MNDICDGEMKNEFEKLKYYDLLNSEKITPYFVKLAKSSIKECSLSVICNNDGSPFQSDRDRNEFIANSYRDIYKKSKDEPDDFSGCIDDFLGPQICQHNLVKQSKLTLPE